MAVIMLVEMSNNYAQRTLSMDDMPSLPMQHRSIRSPASARAGTNTTVDRGVNEWSSEMRYSRLPEAIAIDAKPVDSESV